MTQTNHQDIQLIQPRVIDFNTTPVQDLFDLCHAFEVLKGISGKSLESRLHSQFKIINSEVKELQDGIYNCDDIEILDGAVDAAVTVFGMLNLLSENGYDVVSAMQRVAYNNLSKFTANEDIAKESVRVLSQEHPEREFRYEERDGRPFGAGILYAVLDSNDKLCKPTDFAPVKLDDLVPAKVN